jgi:hypothetical protein
MSGRERWSRRGRARILAGIAFLAGCGARTELLGSLDEDGGAEDAATSRDAAFVDAPTEVDASERDAARHDASTPRDASPDGPADAAMVDAGQDAAPIITCSATTATTLTEDAQSELDQILLDDSYVYFHDQAAIWRVAKTGGAKTAVALLKAPVWPELTAFALDDTSVTWWQIVNGASETDVKRASKQGGTTTTIAKLGSYFYYGSGAPAGAVYVWGGGGPAYNTLESITPDGTVTTVSAPLPNITFQVRYDRGEVFALAQAGLFHLDGDAFTNLAQQPNGYPNSMVFDDVAVYVTITDGMGGFSVASVPRAGGTFTTLLVVQKGYLGGIAADADHLYVADRIAARLLRMNKDGTDLTAIATSTAQIVDVALDDLCVYWTETTNTGTPPSRVRAQAK